MSNEFGIKGYPAAFTQPLRGDPVSSTAATQSTKTAGQPTSTVPATGVAGNEAATEKHADIQDTVQELNSMAQDLHRELRFSVDGETGDTIIKIIDQQTDEVIRQIPSEELIELRQRLAAATGAIFSDSA